MKMMQKILLPLLVVLGFTSCTTKSINYATTFPTGVEIVANELDREMYGDINSQIAFTSLVNLNDFKESNKFGRLFSESLMTQMEMRGFNVIEYRGDALVTKNTKGEFHLNRARVSKIKDKNVLLLVGTYAEMDDNVIVNVRIIQRDNLELVSAASVYMPERCGPGRCDAVKKIHRVQLIKSDCALAKYCWKDIYE